MRRGSAEEATDRSRPQQTAADAAAMCGPSLAEQTERQAAVDRSSCSRLTSRRSPVRAGHRPSRRSPPSDADRLPSSWRDADLARSRPFASRVAKAQEGRRRGTPARMAWWAAITAQSYGWYFGQPGGSGGRSGAGEARYPAAADQCFWEHLRDPGAPGRRVGFDVHGVRLGQRLRERRSRMPDADHRQPLGVRLEGVIPLGYNRPCRVR